MKFAPEIKKIFDIFGDDIRLVGGCVRDLLLEKKVNDFDFATRFIPSETIKILERNKIKAVPTGVKFGTITAVIDSKNFEITTLRKDNETDGRHCEPEFVDDYALDAARRDFTVNALYMDRVGKISDYFDGISDLKKQKIRFIGDANERIAEDYLRILRFFRFSARYAKSLDSEGFAACVSNKSGLKKLSRERIRQEFLKLLASPNKNQVIKILRAIKRSKISDQIFSSGLDIDSFARLKSDDSKLQIAALLLNKNFNFEEICATNFEKKTWNFIGANKQNLDADFIRELRVFNDDEMVWNFCLFVAAKKNLALPKKFKKLPDFVISSQDLIDLGFRNKEIGEAMKLAKKIWAKSNFKIQKQDILQSLKHEKI